MELALIVLIGFTAVAVLDAVGSILSRQLKFNYMWLTIGSTIIYGMVAFFAASIHGTLIGVLASGLMGVFDSTVGLLISKRLKANAPGQDMANMKISLQLSLTVGTLAAIVGLLTILLLG